MIVTCLKVLKGSVCCVFQGVYLSFQSFEPSTLERIKMSSLSEIKAQKQAQLESDLSPFCLPVHCLFLSGSLLRCHPVCRECDTELSPPTPCITPLPPAGPSPSRHPDTQPDRLPPPPAQDITSHSATHPLSQVIVSHFSVRENENDNFSR